MVIFRVHPIFFVVLWHSQKHQFGIKIHLYVYVLVFLAVDTNNKFVFYVRALSINIFVRVLNWLWYKHILWIVRYFSQNIIMHTSISIPTLSSKHTEIDQTKKLIESRYDLINHRFPSLKTFYLSLCPSIHSVPYVTLLVSYA